MLLQKEKRDSIYKQIEAMYWKKYSCKYIINTMQMRYKELSEFIILDIIQDIFGKEQLRKERSLRAC